MGTSEVVPCRMRGPHCSLHKGFVLSGYPHPCLPCGLLKGALGGGCQDCGSVRATCRMSRAQVHRMSRTQVCRMGRAQVMQQRELQLSSCSVSGSHFHHLSRGLHQTIPWVHSWGLGKQGLGWSQG